MFLKSLLTATVAIAGLTICDSKHVQAFEYKSAIASSTNGSNKATPKATPSKLLIKSSNPKSRITSGANFQKVEAKDPQTYKYKTGLFSINVPKAWQPADRSKLGEVIVLWFDPTKNALIAVDIFKAPPNLTPDKSTALLQTFLKNTFGSKPNFAMEAPVKQSDGSVQVVWGYTESVKAGQTTASGWVQGNSFVEVKGDKISLLTVGLLSTQFNNLKDPLTKVINSYKVTPSVKIN